MLAERGLTEFELAQLASLNPGEVDEARALVPSLEVRTYCEGGAGLGPGCRLRVCWQHPVQWPRSSDAGWCWARLGAFASGEGAAPGPALPAALAAAVTRAPPQKTSGSNPAAPRPSAPRLQDKSRVSDEDLQHLLQELSAYVSIQ